LFLVGLVGITANVSQCNVVILMSLLSHSSPHSKQHLDQFIRFCRACSCNQKTDVCTWTIVYDTLWLAISVCSQNLIYRTEPRTEKVGKRKTKKLKTDMLRNINDSLKSVLKKIGNIRCRLILCIVMQPETRIALINVCACFCAEWQLCLCCVL